MIEARVIDRAARLGALCRPPPRSRSLGAWATHFLPVGALYAVYLWGSNACYDYLEVGFVQMLKPSCGLFTYFLLLRGGLETWTTRKALNLLVMFGALSTMAYFAFLYEPPMTTVSVVGALGSLPVPGAVREINAQLYSSLAPPLTEKDEKVVASLQKLYRNVIR